MYTLLSETQQRKSTEIFPQNTSRSEFFSQKKEFVSQCSIFGSIIPIATNFNDFIFTNSILV